MRRKALQGILSLLLVARADSAVFTSDKPEWSAEFKGGPVGHPALFGDIEKNRGLLITEHNGQITLLSPRGEALLNLKLDLPMETPAVAADLSGKGNLSILAVDTWGSIYCFDEQGRRQWKYSLQEKSGEFRLPVFADLDGDGRVEILVSDSRGHLRVLDAQGLLRLEVKATNYRVSVPAVGDVNGDGKPEIIFGTEAGEVYCLSSQGDLLWTATLDGCFGRAFPLIADADNNGSYEVYWPTAFNNPQPGLFALDAATGQQLWKAPSVLQTYRSTVMADLDGDGRNEILFGDKNNSLFCLDAYGKQRWTTQLPGRGIFFAPALADLGGEGAATCFAVVRGSGSTGQSLYALDAAGKLKAGLTLPGGGACSPMLCRFEGRSDISLVVGSASGKVLCHQLDQKPGARILWPGVRNDVVNSGYVKSSAQPVKLEPPLATSGKAQSRSLRLQGGSNQLPISGPTAEADLLEVRAVRPDKSVRIELLRKAETAKELQANLSTGLPGNYDTMVRAINLQRNSVLWTEKFSGRLDKDYKADAAELQTAIGDLNKSSTAVPEYAQLAGCYASRAFAAFERARLTRAGRDFDTLHSLCDYFLGLFKLLRDQQVRGSLLLSQIANPWENFEAARFFNSPTGSVQSISVNMLGNEYESAAIALSNLRDQAVTVRFACGAFQGGNHRVEAKEVLTFHEVISVRPDGTGELTEDALPRLGEGQTLRLEAGETRKVWLTFHSRLLPAGKWGATLRLGVLGAVESPQEIPVSVDVSRVRLPDRYTYRECNWLYLQGIRDESLREATMRDALEHGMNVFVIPGVSIEADQDGRLGKETTEEHDKLVRALGSNVFFLVSGPVSVQWPASAKPDAAQQERVFANALRWYGAHMLRLGFGYENFAIYLQDEPGLMGRDASFEAFVAQVKRFKAAEPRIQLYANPAGGARAELLRPLQSLIDVWAPDLHLLREQPKELGEIFRHARQYWHYEAPGDQRYLDPLGFYRVKPWVAFQLGMTGGGYWVYSSADYWFAEPGGGTEYGTVYPTDNGPVTTKRWEASRDGIEDFELLNLVRKTAERSRGALKQEATKLIAEAVGFVTQGQEKVTDISRHVRPYTPDFAKWMEYRWKLIDLQGRLEQ